MTWASAYMSISATLMAMRIERNYRPPRSPPNCAGTTIRLPAGLHAERASPAYGLARNK
jgi:hypothetical protein